MTTPEEAGRAAWEARRMYEHAIRYADSSLRLFEDDIRRVSAISIRDVKGYLTGAEKGAKDAETYAAYFTERDRRVLNRLKKGIEKGRERLRELEKGG